MTATITAPEHLDLAWILICTALVFLMQAGFCLLEGGLVRTKNSINVAVKNLLDCVTSFLVYGLIGFPLMFGADLAGMIGTPGSIDIMGDGKLTAFFLFQLVFCSTATTIVSGAIAERTRISTFWLIVLFLSGLIYPMLGHWVWGGVLQGTEPGWLTARGFVDFAGSTVVHVVGGFSALAAVIVIGPRKNIPSRHTTGGHSLTLAVLGCFLLWFGWWGFNGGSSLAVTLHLPRVLLNTQIGAAAGGVTAAAICLLFRRRIEVIPLISGVLAGLVSITAGCHVFEPVSAVLAGAVGSSLALSVDLYLRNHGIDDVVSAFPVHGVAGVWGTVATALFTPTVLLEGSRLTFVFIQLFGTVAIAAITFGAMYGYLKCLGRFMSLRVSDLDEERGLNMAEHGATNEVLDLITEMDVHQNDCDLSQPVKVEPHTEAGQIAAQYNRVIARVQDEMTKREETNDWLKSERLRLQSVLEHAGVGIYQLSDKGEFTSVNHTLLNTLGYNSAAELIDGQSYKVVPWLQGSDNEALFSDSLRGGVAVRDIETRFVKRCGEEVWLLESLVPVRNDDGQLINWLGTVHDITTRRQQMIAEVEIAEARSQAKGEFLANMSHEIRTPLNGVIGMLDLLNGTELPEQEAHYVNIARSSADSLLSIINDILDFSKIEAGRMDLEEIQFDLRELVESTSEQFAVRAHMEGLELNCDMASQVPVNVVGDPERLRQVLTNLMGNAIKFTRKGEINLRINREQNSIRFAVEDTGIGMSTEQAAHIFDSFTQADASTTREFGGTGLGLSISYQLVELMGGALHVESVAGRGSTFYFDLTLPVVSASRHSQQSMEALLKKLPTTRVLIVDDNETNCDILKNQLAAWGFDAETCQCSEMAVDRLMLAHRNNRPFNLMLLDMCMPVMDGKDVAKLVRGTGIFAELPIILLSSNHEILSAEERRACGINVAMTKPVRQSRLFDSMVTTIEEMLGHSNAVDDDPTADTGTGHACPQPPFKTPIEGVFLDKELSSKCENGPGASSRAFADEPGPPKSVSPDSSDSHSLERVHSADVLVVEDNQVNQIVVRQMLTSLNHSSAVAANGEEALNMLQSGSYRLILMDGHMPVLDGLKATAKIRRLQSEGSLPLNPDVAIVALTANANSRSRDEFLDAGACDFLSKPVTLARLETALEHLTGSDEHSRNIPPSADDSKPTPESESDASSPESTIPGRTDADVLPGQTEQTRSSATDDEGTALFDQLEFELRCGTDVEFRREVLNLMHSTMNSTVRDIGAARQEGDMATLKGVTHRLKGAAGDCALLAVSRAAAHLETAAVENDSTEIDTRYETLRDRVSETLELLDDILSKES